MSAVNHEDPEREVVGHQDGGFRRGHATALILLFAAIAAAPFAPFTIVYAVAALAWVALRGASLPLRATIVIAILLRLLVIWPAPQLSNDVFRYLWDGKTLASGENPYSRAPLDDPRINHPEIRTIYPPHAEILFAAIHDLRLWRALLLIADVFVVFLLRRSPAAALMYAAFPAAILEGVWSAHIDLLAGAMLLIAARQSSGAAAAVACGLKVTPIAAVPALFLGAPTRVRWAIVFLAVLVIPFVPFFIAGDVMPGFRDYATRWVFNSPMYEGALALSQHIAPPLKSLWTSIKDALHAEVISGFVYRHLYADVVARALLAIIATAGIIWRRRNAVDCIAILLLCSPAIHPWYWLVLAALAIAEGHDAIWLALAAPFSYLPQPLPYLLCYAVPIAVIAWIRLSTRATSGAGSRPSAIRFRTERGTSPT